MAAETAAVSLSTSEYTALSSGHAAVTVTLTRGQRVKLVLAESLPAADADAQIFVGPSSEGDGYAYAVPFVGLSSAAAIYGLAVDRAQDVVVYRQ